MSAHAALARAEASGLHLRAEEGRLRWRSRSEPRADLLADLRENRAGLLSLLGDHDAAEAEAMAAFYAAPAGPPLPDHDAMTAGLLRGYREHRASLLLGERSPSPPRPINDGQELEKWI